jgi:putative endonuclease
MPAHVYILANHSNSVLYIGVTAQLSRRLALHREPRGHDSFTRRYRVTRLVYAEEYPRIIDAIAREKQLKGWRRERKLELIRTLNPNFEDLMPSR